MRSTLAIRKRLCSPARPRCTRLHIGELGDIVAGAFARPDQAGRGEYLPLVGDLMSFNEIIDMRWDHGADRAT
jgi:hypothetical protein